MSKQARQIAIEEFISSHRIKKLPYGENTEFLAYEMERKSRSFVNRKLGSPKASKSLWFVRGEGCI